MKRISLPHFIIIGLLFWGLPAAFVDGPEAIVYTLAAVLPVWLFARTGPQSESVPPRRLGGTTCLILVMGTVIYLTADALFGQKLFQQNVFLFGTTSLDRVIDQINAGVGEGRGIAALLGTFTTLLPFCLIDVAERAPRYGRWALWTVAILVIFYNVTSSRGQVLVAVMAIVLVRASNWRRMILAGGIAFGAFTVASTLRGDAGVQGPMASAVATPYFNLLLMTSSHCGGAPWYSFVLEFLKKFVPAFLFPKSIFSFNVEMSWCIAPGADKNLASVSVFTWMGEILYYRPSLLTALVAGCLMGGMGRIVDRQVVRYRLFSSRMYAGFVCIMLLRSRVLDVMSYLIAQWIFLLFWPQICNLSRTLYRFLLPLRPMSAHNEPGQELS
jgi:hypothetical protein